MKRLILSAGAVLTLSLVITGCTSTEEQFPTPPSTPVIETPAPTPTITPTQAPVITSTPSPVPTETPTPLFADDTPSDDWRTPPSEKAQEINTPPTETQPQTPAPVVKPANPAVPQTTTDKDTQAQQSQSSSDAKKVDTSTFTYPPNSTTEGLTAQDIAQGFYVRTDKDNKVYDQSGQYQGFRLATKDDIVEGSDELNEALYGNDSGYMLDTSGAN